MLVPPKSIATIECAGYWRAGRWHHVGNGFIDPVKREGDGTVAYAISPNANTTPASPPASRKNSAACRQVPRNAPSAMAKPTANRHSG